MASCPKQENEEYILLTCSAIYQSIGAGWSEQGLRIILSDQVVLSGKRLCLKTIFFGTLNITKYSSAIQLNCTSKIYKVTIKQLTFNSDDTTVRGKVCVLWIMR